MKKNFIIAGAIAFLIFASAAGAFYLKNSGSKLAIFGRKQIFLKASFAKVSDKAFNLSNIQSGATSGLGANGSSSERAVSAPAAGGSIKTQSETARNSGLTAMDAGQSSTGMALDSNKTDIACVDGGVGCYNPMPARYKYVYKGEKINLPESRLPVFKRLKGFGKDVNASDILGNFGVDGINLNKFGSAKADNLSLIEQREYGYSLNINFTEGSFSLNQSWNTWPHPENQCKDDACYESFRLKESDMLNDGELTAIAGQFLNDYGVSLDGYGQPEIIDDWRAWYNASSEKTNYYFPDAVSVVYPLIIGGQPVFEEGGAKVGINVSISVREKKVSGVYNLNSQNYQSSLYDIETDQDKILEMAQSSDGGYYYPLMMNTGTAESRPAPDSETGEIVSEPEDDEFGLKERVKEIGLNTPVLGLVRMWIYKDNASDELLVPALIFPINDPGAESWQKNIIVPLVKEIIETRYGNDDGGPVRIMNGANGSSGSSAESSPAEPIQPTIQSVKPAESSSGSTADPVE
ncbi:MAG: hypothetical protein WC745_04925 [Patescibacteria group bacterium]|jgi:hypothetical protein